MKKLLPLIFLTLSCNLFSTLDTQLKHSTQLQLTKKELIIELYDIGAIQFGDFTLKSGATSPVYIDLRKIFSYPSLLSLVAHNFWQRMQHIDFDVLCPVPYAAVPIATAITLVSNKPMIMPRKEIKDHGTKKPIEGVYNAGDRALIIEDLVTSGASVLEVVEITKKEGLRITDVMVLIDREGGGKERLAHHGYTLHALCTLSEAITILEDAHKITSEQINTIQNFLHAN